MKKKKIASIISLCCLMVGLMAIPVHAYNSEIDIRHGDIYSFVVLKDDGEERFYITPKTYTGDYVRVRSRCLDNDASCSAYHQVNRSSATIGYNYGTPVYAGARYQADGYGAPASTWHLNGIWCP